MFSSYHLIEKRTDEVIKSRFVKLWDWLACSKRTKPPYQKSACSRKLARRYKHKFALTTPQNPFKLACIVTVTIRAYFRRIYMKSSEHNGAYISSPICTNRLISSEWTFFMLFLLDMPTNHIISQISILWRHHSNCTVGTGWKPIKKAMASPKQSHGSIRHNTNPLFCEYFKIAHVRYIKILAWLRGFLVIFLYLVWFSLCSSLFCELRDNRVVKNLQFCPQSLGIVLEL